MYGGFFPDDMGGGYVPGDLRVGYVRVGDCMGILMGLWGMGRSFCMGHIVPALWGIEIWGVDFPGLWRLRGWNLRGGVLFVGGMFSGYGFKVPAWGRSGRVKDTPLPCVGRQGRI